MKKILLSSFAALALCVACISNNTPSASTAAITTPDEAIAALKEGNARFVADKAIYPNSTSDRRMETINSQNPYAVIIACSDSRVPVELLFDQGIGDLFVIRTAGNTVADDVVMGSVDYAIDHLGSKLVVVLGHQNCGGVTSTIAHHEGEAHHEGKIAELIEVLKRDIEPYIGHPEQLDEAIHAHAEAQAARINSVDYVREKTAKGEVKVVSAYYSFDSGIVTFDE